MNATLLATSALALLLTLGCSGNSVREAQSDPRMSDPLLDRFIVYDTNSTLAEHVHLERVVRDPSSNPLQVQFDVVNNSGSEFDFMYKVRWFDKNAIQIPDQNEVWRKKTIGGSERLSLTATGPSPRAADYRLVVKEWERVK